MYNKIVNPETNRLVNIYTPKGRQILMNYLNQLGGSNIYRCPSNLDENKYKIEEDDINSDEKCLGCETGTDNDQSHRLEDGRFHPNCQTRSAEAEREKLL